MQILSIGMPFPDYRIEGGAFPIWLAVSCTVSPLYPSLCSCTIQKNSPSVPIGVIGIYSGNSLDDHTMVSSIWLPLLITYPTIHIPGGIDVETFLW